jgi:hypothetical protein
VTQRSAKVNKDVTTQAETLIAFRTTGPQDRDAIDNWIKYHAGEEQREEVLSTLPTLPNGTAWLWSPEWLDTLKQVAVRRRETFDSAATPKPGQKTTKPKTLAAVDLERLRAQMADTVEKAKAEDPRELRKQIAELKKQLAAIKNIGATDISNRNAVEKPVLTDTDRALLEKVQAAVQEAASLAHEDLVLVGQRFRSELQGVAGEFQERVDTVTNRVQAQLTALFERAGFKRILAKLHTAGAGATVPARRAFAASKVRPTASSDQETPDELGRGERKILTAVAQLPAGATRSQLTVTTGYKRSTRDTYLQRLTQWGHVAANGNGHIHVTDRGLAMLGQDYEPLPTGDALREYWLGELPEGERQILQVLVKHHPHAVVREAIDEATGYRRSTRDTYLQRLRARHLVSGEGRGAVRASDELFG